MDALHGENGIETAKPCFLSYFFYFFLLGGRHLAYVHKFVEGVGRAPLGLLVEVFENRCRYVVYAARVFEGFLALDVPHVTVLHAFFFFDGADVCHTEGQHVMVAYGIDDGVRRKLLAEHVGCHAVYTFAA